MIRVWLAVVGVVVVGCGEVARGPIRLTSLGPPALATIGPAGGTLVVEAQGRQLRLEVPPTALAAATEVTLEAVAVEGLAGAAAVRFGPAGLTFDLPATLVVTPAPAGEVLVGLHFDEGASTGTLRGAAPEGEGRSLAIAHFSGAILGTREELIAQMNREDQGIVTDLEDLREAQAFGLADRLALVIAPAAARAPQSVLRLTTASSLLASWSRAVQVTDLNEEPIAPRGETFGGAVARIEGVLLGASEALRVEFEQPRCSDPGGEVEFVDDWLRLHEEIAAVGQLYGNPSLGTPCAHAELSLTGTQALTATDDELVLDAVFRLVGPTGEQMRDGPITFTFTGEGATGPESVRSTTGAATGVRFTRPASPRPPAVRIVADVDLFGYEFPLVEVVPVVLVASEPLAAMATATPAVVGPGEMSMVCVKTFASGQPVTRFKARFSVSGPGRLDTQDVTTTTGEGCVTYLAPASAQSATVTFNASVEVNGAVAVATTSLALTASAVRVTVSSPATTLTVGTTLTLSANVTGATNPAVTWSASGGTITQAGEFTAATSGSYAITATSVEDPAASGQFMVQASCAFPNTAVPGDNRSSINTEARAQVVSGGQLVVNESDVGGASSSVMPGSGTGFSYAASASATMTSVTASTSFTATSPLMVSASAEAEGISRVASLGGVGNGRARVFATISGQTGDDGMLFALVEFDPFDDVGRDAVRFERPFGSGPSSFQQTLTLETPFSYSLSSTSLYVRLNARISQGGNVTLSLTSATVSVDACL